MALSFQGAHVPPDIILMSMRWYVADPVSQRHVEARMAERGVLLDHATVQRWVVQYSPRLAEGCQRRKRLVWGSWRLDEADIQIKGHWYQLSRAVDQQGPTIDVLLTEPRDEQAAKRFLHTAIRRHGVPESITTDGSAANAAAIKSYNTGHGPASENRKGKYLHNSVAQDHRAVQRVPRPMLGCKAFDAAQSTRVGVARMHMLKKNQRVVEAGDEGLTAAAQFYSWPRDSPTDRGN